MVVRAIRFLAGVALFGACAYIAVTVAVSEPADPLQCPPDVKSCKVITISSDEEQTLVGDNMIFAHAEWANRAGFAGIITAWRNKLATAPQGKPAAKSEPKK